MENVKFYQYKKRSIFFTQILPSRIIFIGGFIVYLVNLIFTIVGIRTMSFDDVIFWLIWLIFYPAGLSGVFYGLLQLRPIGINDVYLYHGFTKTGWKKIVKIKEHITKEGRKTSVIRTERRNPFYKRIVINSFISDYEDLKENIIKRISRGVS